MPEVRVERAPINRPAAFMFAVTTIPTLTLFPWYLWNIGFDAFEWTWFFILWGLSGIAVTGGYHRLWAHRSYEASKPLQIFWMLFGAMALQNTILYWASTHRVHHRHVDDFDSDPYSIRRGLWFAHMGWMLRDYPSATLDLSNARDLEANPIVQFQHRHYLLIALGMNFGLALAIGWWHGNVWGCLLLLAFVRLFFNHHMTFLINSLAHYWGRRPYTSANSARDNDLLALLTYGEGYHNYHHIFQWDYRNGVRWWQYDPTKWSIALFAWLGLAKSLKRVPEFQIRKAMLERQFELAQERIGKCRDEKRLPALSKSLADERQHFTQTLGRWTTLQTENVEAAKLKASTEHEEPGHLRALEEALLQQLRRVRSLEMQAA